MGQIALDDASQSLGDDELARILLIELLAYQFCFPVQWIDSQDFILGTKRAERVVEMGVGSTLINMAKRTIAQKFATSDTAQSISRQLLSFQHNYDQISYTNKFAVPAAKNDATHNSPQVIKPHEEPASRPPVQARAASPAVLIAAEVQDRPITALEAASAIICAGMRKPLEGLDRTKSIKTLAGGRSTLQNEIIGDLAAEFSALPEGAEDIPIEAFSSIMQETFAGKLGAKSLSLIEKTLLQKMPGMLQNASIRKYLKQRWGFESGRQDSILLSIVASQPQSKLQNEGHAKIFIDDMVQAYIKQTGLVIPEASTVETRSAAQLTVSKEALELLEGKQKTTWKEQYALYAKLLGIDPHASEAACDALRQRVGDLEGRVENWNFELGGEFASGLQPLFTPLKARTYDSWWNWAMQDVLVLTSMVATGLGNDMDPIFQQLRHSVIERSHARLLATVQYRAATTVDKNIAAQFRKIALECEAASAKQPAVYRTGQSMAPLTTVETSGKVVYSERPRPKGQGVLAKDDELPKLGRRIRNGSSPDDMLSSVLHSVLADGITMGLSFSERTVLVTGAGAGSIGCKLVCKLLAAGAFVIVTSSSYSLHVTRFWQDLYAKHGGKGSRLVLVPFNQASIRDIEALVAFIYGEEGLSEDLDYIIPFAAISANGRTLDNIDSRSELAQRVMLTNTIRLLGKVKEHKHARGVVSRPAQVIIPLSPNHGVFGGDGLYAESKLGLESLFAKFYSEDWSEYLLICGAIIGWTRGTALMSDNDIVSEGIEKLGIRTYSQDEMAFNILGLMSPAVVSLCIDEPLVADLSGGMSSVNDLKRATSEIRDSIKKTSAENASITKDSMIESPELYLEDNIEPLASIELSFPALPDWQHDIMPLAEQLNGMVDLDRVVVVTGFAEVGPWGNSRTRWDMELNGSLSIESCIELAWIMGLIKAHSGILDGQPYSGWVDKESGKPISDVEIQSKYLGYIMKHSGIRYAEPKATAPLWNSAEALHEIEIAKDQDPIDVSKETAIQLKRVHGDKVHIAKNEETGQHTAILKKGARVMIPKLRETPHTVAGQLPTGWDPKTYGVPEDVIAQVDPATLYGLIAAAEALQSAGISDPYELYNYLHVSDVANCVGSGFGGTSNMRKIFKGRYQDQEAAGDILAETFISSGSAWINMLLLSAAGANRTPVGACATALESLDTAFDLIQTGKAKFCLVGGFDDMVKEVADEFASLKATINADEDSARGREPAEMSRPTTSTRSGFVESEGAGVQIVTSASVAIQMGLPIYGIIALTRTAMDKAGRSIPAPGQGILGAAAQTQGKFDSPLLNMAYRKRALRLKLEQSEEIRTLQLSYLDNEIAQLKKQGYNDSEEEYRQHRVACIERDAERERREALNMYGNQFWIHDKRIAPIRGALAVWGLTIDDVDVVSFHGTSTKANEKNESTVLNEQLRHLRRAQGNVVPIVCQKALTGHPKAAAGAWMLNGCFQLMQSGRIPGNRNADNIDAMLQECEYLVFPSEAIGKTDVKAFITQSFGFGQKGAMTIGVHPKYLFATMEHEEVLAYERKLRLREEEARRTFGERLFNNTVFRAKEVPSYPPGENTTFLLDPEARTKP